VTGDRRAWRLVVVLTGIVALLLLCSSSSAFAASSPAIDGESASLAGPFAAALEAQVNPEGQPTTECEFEYGTSTAYGTSMACSQGVLEGEGDQLASVDVSGLKAGTTYHFRVLVKNATGETTGTDGEFTTQAAEAPVVAEEGVSALTGAGATLEAQIDPSFQETSCRFEYGTSPSLAGSTVVSCQPESLGEGGSPVGASLQLEGLQPRTTYYYRARAVNATGSASGPIQSFTTLASPVVTTGAAEDVTRVSALLTGAANPSGAATTYRFLYIEQAAYEAALARSEANPYAEGASTPEQTLGSDYASDPVGAFIEGLRPGATYHYALVATNSFGTVTGPDMVLTAGAPTPPLVTTGEATGVTALSATLTGTVDARELPTLIEFQLGIAPEQGTLGQATTVPGAGSTLQATLAYLGDLQPSTTYYYRLQAINADGSSYGAERSFTTTSIAGLTAPAVAGTITWPPTITAVIAAIEHPPSNPTPPTAKPPTTKAQHLAKALKACSRQPKHKRLACRRQAKRRYR
jgi:hypothetical protein